METQSEDQATWVSSTSHISKPIIAQLQELLPADQDNVIHEIISEITKEWHNTVIKLNHQVQFEGTCSPQYTALLTETEKDLSVRFARLTGQQIIVPSRTMKLSYETAGGN